jgi:hypothetical protein
MAQQATVVVAVKMLHCLSTPRTIWATDDPNEIDPARYKTRNYPALDLVEEVFAKIIACQRNGTPVQLMIEDNLYIVRDLNYPVPGISAHLETARNAADAVHTALNLIETSIAPAGAMETKSRANPTTPSRGPKKPSAKTRKQKPRKKRDAD